AGFVALMVFLVLAPTSTIVPIQDLANEHRMYLSTAGVIVLVVVGVAAVLPRAREKLGWTHARMWWVATGAVAVVAVSLGVRTIVRNLDYRDQETIWHSVLAERPHNPRAHSQVANAYAHRGMDREAIAHYTEALLIEPSLWKARSNLGQTLLKYNSVDAAVKLFRDAVELKPNFFEARTNLGDALVTKGEIDEALEHLRRATQLDPDNPVGHNNYGRGLFAAGRYRAAERSFRRAIEFEPGPDVAATVHRNLGNALNAQGRSRQAIAAWTTSFELVPDPSVANNIGGLHLQEGRRAEAIPHFVAALRLEPAHERAINNLAIALGQSGDPDPLATPYRDVPGVVRAWARAYEIVGDEHRRGGRLAEARSAYTRALQIRPDQSYARQALDALDGAGSGSPGG
ncbi:MAG: tetratricopeptide repeat protein, partial [Phycisphaerales bacterium]|nr:tetratricopeptide repeat protein [Phycisphaerales bacterium]